MTNDRDLIPTKEKLLTRREAAKFLSIAENTLAVWACTKRYTLPMVKISKLIRYKLSDLIEFIDKFKTY